MIKNEICKLIIQNEICILDLKCTAKKIYELWYQNSKSNKRWSDFLKKEVNRRIYLEEKRKNDKELWISIFKKQIKKYIKKEIPNNINKIIAFKKIKEPQP